MYQRGRRSLAPTDSRQCAADSLNVESFRFCRICTAVPWRSEKSIVLVILQISVKRELIQLLLGFCSQPEAG